LVTASTSYEDADDTAHVLESEKTLSGQVMATYSMLQGRAAVSATFRGEEKENDGFVWFGTAATNTDKNTSNRVNQDWESGHTAWSVDAWWQAGDRLNLFAEYMKDTLKEDANWLLSQRRRWEALNVFAIQEDDMGYKADNDTYSLGVSYQLTPKAGLLVSYLVSDSTSEINSGTTNLENLTEIDNVYQNLNLELNMNVSRRSDLTLGYLYEDYKDDAEEGHDGRNQTVSVAYKLKF
jgi:predicted porin